MRKGFLNSRRKIAGEEQQKPADVEACPNDVSVPDGVDVIRSWNPTPLEKPAAFNDDLRVRIEDELPVAKMRTSCLDVLELRSYCDCVTNTSLTSSWTWSNKPCVASW